MKIDIFAHIFPQAAFDRFFEAAPDKYTLLGKTHLIR